MSIKQGIISKKTATNKNKKSRYKYITNRSVGQTARNGKIDKKYSYSKKIYKNGKYRYYYD